MKKIIFIKLFIFSLLVVGLSSCADDIIGKIESIPNAFGKVNEVTILSDQDLWEGTVGDTLDFYFTGAYPITPTPEPMLDLRHFNYSQINGRQAFKHYRSYIILANLANKESEVTKMVIQDIGQEKYRRALKDPTFNTIVGKNKWANGQILIYLFAATESQLIDVVRSKYPNIVERIYSHDYSQIYANTYSSGESLISKNALREVVGFNGKIPKEFEIAKKSPQEPLIWFRKDDKGNIQNVIVKSIPYTSDKQFEKEQIIELVEDFGSKHIDGNKLLVNDRDLPTYEYVKSKKGKYIKEIRGIWETEKGYMGGPYIAYLIKEPNSDNLIFTFSFIYAAGEKKRNLMQRMEVIMNGISADILIEQ